MDLDFGNYALAPLETREYAFGGLAGQPTLDVRPATKRNVGYINAILKVPGGGGGDGLTPERLRIEHRATVRVFARHIVTGWKNVTDRAGNPVPFSAEACERFLLAIPEFMFDELVSFCSRARNFVEAAPTEHELAESEGN